MESRTKKTEPMVTDVWTRSSARMLFLSLLQHSIARGARQPDYRFAVLYLDLDRFTLINGSLGKVAGDQLLVEVAQRLRGCLRTGDEVIRLREDEYVFLVDDIQDISNAETFATRVVADVLRPAFRLDGQEIFVSASIGVAEGPVGYSNAEEIVRDAEAAMHQAKSKGRGGCEIFDPKLRHDARMLLTLESQLRAAIELNQLRLEFEPIVSLANDNSVRGYETLLRWQHHERGLLYPGQFLGAADETGLIVPITQWVIRESCRQLKTWQDHLPGFENIWLTVNLSPKYIERADFAQEISAYITESGVNASNLICEITETQLLEKGENILQGFRELNEKGVKLWIDDFGSGYSSFAYLVNFPIHALKIDRSFITNLTQDNNSDSITKAIVSLGKTLGLEVIAEGVERKNQLDYLLSVSCPYAQGHLFSKSVNAKAVETAFSKDRKRNR